MERKIRKSELERLVADHKSKVWEMKQALNTLTETYDTLCLPIEAQMQVSDGLLEEFKVRGKELLADTIANVPLLLQDAVNVGKGMMLYELQEEYRRTLEELEQEPPVEVEGAKYDTQCIVEDCERTKHFGDYCKRHVPQELRPTGKP